MRALSGASANLAFVSSVHRRSSSLACDAYPVPPRGRVPIRPSRRSLLLPDGDPHRPPFHRPLPSLVSCRACVFNTSGGGRRRHRLSVPCCGHEKRWPERARGFRQTGGAGSEQAEPGRLGDRGGPGGDPELADDVGDVAVDGVLAQVEVRGDLRLLMFRATGRRIPSSRRVRGWAPFSWGLVGWSSA